MITTENMLRGKSLPHIKSWTISHKYDLESSSVKKKKNSKPITAMESLGSITYRLVESHKKLIMCCPSHAAGEGLRCNSSKPMGAMLSSLACTPAAQWRLPSTACLRCLWSCCANVLLNSAALHPYLQILNYSCSVPSGKDTALDRAQIITLYVLQWSSTVLTWRMDQQEGNISVEFWGQLKGPNVLIYDAF